MKSILYASLCGITLIVGSLAWEGYFTPKKVVYVAPPKPIQNLPDVVIKKEVSLLFVGDVMLDRGVKNIADKVFNGEISAIFENIKKEIFLPDISVFNLEGPVSDKGQNVGSIYSFHMSTSTFDVVKEIGFDLASFTNNHVGDWGREAFDDTLTRAEVAGIPLIGAGTSYASTSEPVIVEKNGMRIGFLGFSDVGPAQMKAGTSTSGILLLSDPNLEMIIKRAQMQVDELVVSIHWGDEYKKYPTEKQKEFGHKIIDWGAKLIVGHHPHVIEPLEEYNGGLIVYSLGNFVFDQAFSKETMEGGVLEILFDMNGIKKYELKKAQLDSQFRPSFVENSTL